MSVYVAHIGSRRALNNPIECLKEFSKFFTQYLLWQMLMELMRSANYKKKTEILVI